MLVAFGAADDTRLDIFAVADALWRQGWYLDRQSPPPSLHCTVNAVHDGRIDDFLARARRRRRRGPARRPARCRRCLQHHRVIR
ncbi:MAG: hypothetical protein H0U21_11940 [Acidimicrobiia bacterium]|nr:hypothetical protein [Acidimicrobiia bacterium]